MELSARRAAKARLVARLLDHGPGHDDLLIPGPGPFDVHHRNASQHALPDGLVHLGGPEGLDEALPLEFLLVRLHRQGDIDGQHEREIDLGLGAGTPDPRTISPAASSRAAMQRLGPSILSSRSGTTCYR